jgi:hypothetical protein
MENMSFSHNLELLMSHQTTTQSSTAPPPQVRVTKIQPKDVIQTVQEKLRHGKNLPVPPLSPEVTTEEAIPQIPEEPPANIEESPPYAPYSPAYQPTTPEIQQSTPLSDNSRYQPMTPDLPPPSHPFLQLQPTTPEFPPPPSQTEFKKGDLVHFRGDTKPARLWEVQEIGKEFISIRTEDNENLEAKDNVKIVTRGDIYTPSTDYPYQSGGYIYPTAPNQYMADYASIGGGLYQQAPPPLPTNQLPVNITFAPKLVGGNDNSKTYQESSTAPSEQSQTTGEKSSSSYSFFQPKSISAQDFEGGKEQEGNEYDTLSSKSKIDFNQVMVKKLE